jgi:HAD superfamily hydrolase (TIGR01509 family)
MPKLRAIFFDFDVFKSSGFEYRLEEFQQIVGTDKNPRALLEERVGRSLDWEKIEPERREVETKLGLDMKIKPGVMELVHDARSRGWICAVVSSSPHYWIRGHLERCEVIEHFDGFICRGDAPNAKPAPDLYLEALRQFNLIGSETVALEDSHNGSLAAKHAGIWCVAVPNDITRSMDFSHADLVTENLEELTLNSLDQRFG